ncbi:Glucosamine--fructose-6-phosphate aminotransferase [Nitrincola nitratireducens]|uniref:Glucosamine--fructose-6-phosphate aminotransferase n=1 Tax=Nitrincola nitratireducens TaxID=1229521 RepID=W9V100_9GAMM|nr:Glucosamine--fructose-6-phosphate aminotransferase [Nitrincola nitratireducens]
MCGIVAANASVDSIDFLISGLKQLEYRGYDSAGLAVLGEREPQRFRALGRVAELEALTKHKKLRGL